MSIHPENAHDDQQAADAIDRLKAAISSLAIEELRAPIEEELGLRDEINFVNFRDSLEVLKARAMLGQPESLETLVGLGNEIAHFLESIAPAADRDAHPSSYPSPTGCDGLERSSRETIDEAVDALLDLEETRDIPVSDLLAQLSEDLPAGPFSFPLQRLLGQSEPLDELLRKVADYCDRLIEQRFAEERARLALECSRHSYFWPILIRAINYDSKRTLADLTRHLELGRGIAANLDATSRGEDTPTELVRRLLIVLDQCRRVRRTVQELESMRLGEEGDDLPPLQQLMDEARERAAKVDQVQREWEKQRRNGKLNDRQFLKSLLKNALKSFENNGWVGLIWESRLRTDRWTEDDVLELHIQAACAKPPARYGSWGLDNLWERKAALLPELSSDAQVISLWVEAAYAYVASLRNGDLQSKPWVAPIEKAITKSGSLDAGIKQFLRNGFETLSGKDLRG